MQRSLKTLLGGLLDYAGMFPPAQLPLSETLQNFSEYLDGDKNWFLARLVLPCGSLTEVEKTAGARIDSSTKPWHFSILCKGAPTSAAFLESVAADFDVVLNFAGARAPGNCMIDALEAPIPPELCVAGKKDDTNLFLQALHSKLRMLPARPRFFLEMGNGAEHVIPVIAAFNEKNATNFAAKFRTGGLTPDAIPTSETTATLLCKSAEAKLAFKATAGLHHLMRNFDKNVGTDLNGIFNVWIAAAFAWHCKATPETLKPILLNMDPSAFCFSDSGFSYGAQHFTNAQLAELRHNFALSVGSCSFVEPLEDLENFK